MKRVRNRKLAHQDGNVEWIISRAAFAFGRQQELALRVLLTPFDYQADREHAAFALRRARRRLRAYVASVANT